MLPGVSLPNLHIAAQVRQSPLSALFTASVILRNGLVNLVIFRNFLRTSCELYVSLLSLKILLSLFPEGHVEIQRKQPHNIFKSCRFCARLQPRGYSRPQNQRQLFLTTLNIRNFFYETRKIIVTPTFCLLWEGVESIVYYLLTSKNLVLPCNNLP